MTHVSESRPVAIVGAGVVNPVATGIPAFEQALRQGVPSLSQLSDMPIPRGKSTAGLVTDSAFAGPDKGLLMALASAEEALLASGMAAERMALIVATMAGDSHAAEAFYPELARVATGDTPARPVLADAVAGYPNGALLRKLAARLGVRGQRFVVSNACASGNIAVGLALDLLRTNRCEAVLVVGLEVLKPSMLWGAERAGFVGTALRPFHRDRDGAILGEGAAALVLACPPEESPAQAWIEGFGSVCDRGAAPITLAADGSGLERAMQLALGDAGRPPADVEYVSAHAPGTRMIDMIECHAVARVCGKSSTEVSINATKSITTHLSGASAVTEIIAAVLQMRGSFLHGNAGLDVPDPALGMQPVPPSGMDRTTSFALSNACGGGGLNTSVAIGTTRVGRGRLRAAAAPEGIVLTGVGTVYDPAFRWASRPLRSTHKVAGALASFDIRAHYEPELNYEFMNRAAQLAAGAAEIALTAVGIAPGRLPCADDRFAVIAGTTLGGAPQASAVLCEGLATRPNAITPSMSLDHGIHLGAALICRYFGLTGTTYTITGSRRSGLQALEIAALTLQAGRADVALALGYDAFDAFESHLCERLGLPFYTADAAGAILLERTGEAQRRGAIACAQLVDVRTLPAAASPDQTASALAAWLSAHPCEWLYLAASAPEKHRALVDAAMSMLSAPPVCLEPPVGAADLRAGLAMTALADAMSQQRRAVIVAPGTDGVILVVAIAPLA